MIGLYYEKYINFKGPGAVVKAAAWKVGGRGFLTHYYIDMIII